MIFGWGAPVGRLVAALVGSVGVAVARWNVSRGLPTAAAGAAALPVRLYVETTAFAVGRFDGADDQAFVLGGQLGARIWPFTAVTDDSVLLPVGSLAVAGWSSGWRFAGRWGRR
ncbi:hypothetical protein GCM10012279_02990 [Micromonospora yangpuensis]|nr:hypothetical protein GCM10012279_02990 [Micromonospora yangpuensis]